MDNKIAQKMSKYKLFIFIGIEILVVLTIFLLIFFAGRKTYTVTFDINGGELLSGDLVQNVRRGGSATPPNVARQGCYLLRWSGSYNKVTGDVKCTAVWEYETTAGIEYEVIEGGNYCLISGCYKELSGDVYVGAYYDGLKVLGIKDGAFKDCAYIESLFFLDGIISIGDNAFEGCTSLKTINLPDTTERIGYRAFADCVSLENVAIPESTKRIGAEAFVNCTALTEVEILVKTEDDKTAGNKNDDKDVSNDDAVVIGGTEIIGDRAFAGCTSLEAINLPITLKQIGDEAFLNCAVLKEIVLPLELQKIGDAAFLGCDTLTEVRIPSTVVEMGEYVFDNPNLTIYVDIFADEIPETWNKMWFAANKAIEYRTDNLPEDAQ